jgi:hypothetical protein
VFSCGLIRCVVPASFFFSLTSCQLFFGLLPQSSESYGISGGFIAGKVQNWHTVEGLNRESGRRKLIFVIGYERTGE